MIKILYSEGNNLETREVLEYINSYVMLEDSGILDIFEIRKLKREMLFILESLNSNYYVVNSPPIISNRLFLGKFVVFVKRMISRTIGWYIHYIIKQQSEINANIIRCLNCSTVLLDSYERENKAFKEKVLNNC